MKQVIAPVVSCAEMMPGVHLLWAEASEIAAEAQPGQFVTARCGDDVLLRRPFSIHGIDGEKLALLFTVVGQGTKWLAGRTEGESLDLLGPLGNGFKIHQGSRRLLLVAGGIGIAPLIHLAEKAAPDGFSVKLALGAATASQLYPGVKGVELIRATEDGSAGEKGMVTDLLPSLAGWADQIFACGPIPMYQAMAEIGTELRNKPVQVLLEQVMGCGVGACHGCTVRTNQGTKMVCHDGPVFELGEIIWEEVRAPGVSSITKLA